MVCERSELSEERSKTMLEKELSEQEILSFLDDAFRHKDIESIGIAAIEIGKRKWEGKIPPEAAQAYLLECQVLEQILMHEEK